MKKHPIIIGVAGLQGSGKTTLARSLAQQFGWTFVAESATAKRYLSDLFIDQKLAFEAQIGFLCNKSISIQQQLLDGQNIVIDRTIFEDAMVYAKYFKDIKMINDRAYSIYQAIANHFMGDIPEPDITIYCHCSVGVAKQRIESRIRENKIKYPENHIDEIAVLYDEWLDRFNFGPLVRINSEENDFRDEEIVQNIAEEIAWILSGPQRDKQRNLFSPFLSSHDEIKKPIVEKIKGMDKISNVISRSEFDPVKQPVDLPTAPFAYIAAPFTEFAQPSENSKNDNEFSLIPLPSPHGTIPTGVYRNALLGIEKKLLGLNLQSLIPHRDVNRWGRKQVSSENVYMHCKLAVQKADIVIAIMGYSPGSHFEVGFALGLRKPVVVIQCDEIPTSYLASGTTRDIRNVFVVRCDRVRNIPSAIDSVDVQNFIKRSIEL